MCAGPAGPPGKRGKRGQKGDSGEPGAVVREITYFPADGAFKEKRQIHFTADICYL